MQKFYYNRAQSMLAKWKSACSYRRALTAFDVKTGLHCSKLFNAQYLSSWKRPEELGKFTCRAHNFGLGQDGFVLLAVPTFLKTPLCVLARLATWFLQLAVQLGRLEDLMLARQPVVIPAGYQLSPRLLPLPLFAPFAGN